RPEMSTDAIGSDDLPDIRTVVGQAELDHELTGRELGEPSEESDRIRRVVEDVHARNEAEALLRLVLLGCRLGDFPPVAVEGRDGRGDAVAVGIRYKPDPTSSALSMRLERYQAVVRADIEDRSAGHAASKGGRNSAAAIRPWNLELIRERYALVAGELGRRQKRLDVRTRDRRGHRRKE